MARKTSEGYWEITIGGAAFLIVIFTSYYIGTMIGAGGVRSNTIVRMGVPYYAGVYFGQCAYLKDAKGSSVQICATDRDSPPSNGFYPLQCSDDGVTWWPAQNDYLCHISDKPR